ncbi:MAG: glycosyltransferase [Candidatus Beckwithbacteria bacterium]|nr:glycosyltransferase [Patescibacteria group bacterium]
MSKLKTVSIIIPAFKQEKTILKDLKRIQTALKTIRYPYEIIVVIDGAIDQTYRKTKKLSNPNLKVYLLKANQGKGYAVRYGMTKAKGDYIAFLDSGMEIDPNAISMLLEHLEWYDADVIVGSKRHLASTVNYPFDRKILSYAYYQLVRLLFGVKIRDTQSGIKVFKRKVLTTILSKLVVKKYAFDIEMLAVAHRKGFKKIFEAPIKLKYKFGSVTDAATLDTIYHMLYDTLAVFYRLKIMRYYD